MNTLIFAYALETYATQRLVSHLHLRGHRAILASPLDCTLVIRSNTCSLMHKGEPLPPVDAVFLRGLTYYDNGTLVPRVVETSMAAVAMSSGALCFNSPESKTLATNKLATALRLASAGIPTPVTIVCWSADTFERALAEIGTPIILKMVDGTRGSGVVRCDTAESARSTFDILRTTGQPFLIQQYVGEPDARQIRVLVVGNRVLGAHCSIPKEGEFRANLAKGASVQRHDLLVESEQAALAASASIGLDISGVDLIETSGGPQVLEVNSVPGLEMIDRICSIDATAAIVDLVEQRVQQHRARTSRPLSGE